MTTENQYFAKDYYIYSIWLIQAREGYSFDDLIFNSFLFSYNQSGSLSTIICLSVYICSMSDIEYTLSLFS